MIWKSIARSGLSFLSKLVERVVTKQLNNHVQENSLGNRMQSAYKAGHSTETALLAIKNDVLAMSKGEAMAVVFLDLSAAFAPIDHETLMDRLKAWFGISGKILSWFRSYLCDRFHSIKIEEAQRSSSVVFLRVQSLGLYFFLCSLLLLLVLLPITLISGFIFTLMTHSFTFILLTKTQHRLSRGWTPVLMMSKMDDCKHTQA